MSKQNDFIKAPVFGISEDELATGSVNDNEVGTINGKKIKAKSITSDQIAAGAIGAVQLQAGAITAFKITTPNRIKGTTVVFSIGGSNNDTLQWTDGVAYLMKMKYTPDDTMGDLQVVQVQQNISAGSYQFKSGDGAYYFYVEWAKDQNSDEPADSATLTMQKSTTYPDSDTAIVLAYAWYDSVLGLAQFQALDTAGGGVRISGNSILAGSITAQNIRAGTITADKLSFQAFDKSKDTLDSVADGSQYARVLKTDISAGHILLDSVVQNGTYGLLYRTYISAGKLSLTYGVTGKLNNANLDTDNPSAPGLYMTYYHLGYWNGAAWTVDIQSNGTAIFGIDGSSNYLKWDGSKLTVRGDVEANSISANVSITSPYIILNGSGFIAGGKIFFDDTNNGFWLGYYNGNYTFNIGNSSQYLKWDGSSLNVQGNITSSTITSSTITGGTLETNASGERIEITSSNHINFYDSYNTAITTINAPTGIGLTIRSYLGINEIADGQITIQSNGQNINLIAGNGYYITAQSPIYMSVNQPIYFGGTNSGIYGSGGNLTVTAGMSINGLLYAGYGIQSNGTISLNSGYGIQFSSPSGKGGHFWYNNGTLYFTDENGTQHAISYT